MWGKVHAPKKTLYLQNLRLRLLYPVDAPSFLPGLLLGSSLAVPEESWMHFKYLCWIIPSLLHHQSASLAFQKVHYDFFYDIWMWPPLNGYITFQRSWREWGIVLTLGCLLYASLVQYARLWIIFGLFLIAHTSISIWKDSGTSTIAMIVLNVHKLLRSENTQITQSIKNWKDSDAPTICSCAQNKNICTWFGDTYYHCYDCH